MYQVAVYGKGGIGKSTMSANISYALSGMGLKVLQVGCDPKHDSTRLLLGGRSQTTVLDYVRTVPLAKRCLDDVIVEGSGGVLCAEAGGPEPGIGCAGRGILTTFDTLRKLGADSLPTDVRIYDVLGDVVCGGFAVPLRGEYADGIILVTSGEFMSLYAANNIMKGISNFDTGSPRVIGIIQNSRGVENEDEMVSRFAEATGVEVIGVMPRDRTFAEAEGNGHTVREMFPDSDLSVRIDAVARRIVEVRDGVRMAVNPRPLDDDQLSDLAAGRPIRPGSGKVTGRVGCSGCDHRMSIKDTKVMSSCAAYGAAAAYLKMNDVTVILHGPLSCMYMMDTSRNKAVLDLYQKDLFKVRPNHNLVCTCMDDTVSIFGGNGLLERSLDDAVASGARKVAVITTCMPGIIGDDCETLIRRFSSEHPDIRFDYIPADGDIAGEYTDGFMMAAESIADMIDTSVEPEDGYVNLIGTSFFDLHTRESLDALTSMLERFGLRENCRFLDETSSDTIGMFCRGSIDMMVGDTPMNRELAGIIRRRTGREPFPHSIPVGLYNYEEWLDALGERMGKRAEASEEVRRVQAMYDSFIDSHKGRFAGKRVIIMNKMNSNVDWLIDLLKDLGVEILKVGIAPNPRRKVMRAVTRHTDLVTEEYTDEMLVSDVLSLSPDLLISDIVRRFPGMCRFARFSKVGLGVEPTLRYAEYLENIMRLPAEEGWKRGLRL